MSRVAKLPVAITKGVELDVQAPRLRSFARTTGTAATAAPAPASTNSVFRSLWLCFRSARLRTTATSRPSSASSPRSESAAPPIASVTLRLRLNMTPPPD